MSYPSSKETTPLTKDHENHENANAQETPPPSYAEAKGVPLPYMTPPSQHKENPIPYAPTTTTVFVVPLEFNSKPAEVMCPYCNVQVTTRTEYEAGTLSWLLCCLVCICALCCNFTKDVNHYCPICNRRLGRYHRPCSPRVVLFIVLVFALSFILGIILGIVNIMMFQMHRY